jgi:hypothetical protein
LKELQGLRSVSALRLNGIFHGGEVDIFNAAESMSALCLNGIFHRIGKLIIFTAPES